MKIYRDLASALPVKNAVVTTGSFDGVHVGHKVILNRLNTIAREIGGESVLVTFHPHPRKVLYPDSAGKDLKLISSQREKIELLRKAGLDNLLIVTFTPEFAQMTSIDFIRKVLVDKLHTRKVVIGFNHHFGRNREGDYEYLLELGKFYGFTVEEIPQQDIDNETVSSTKIRQALADGRIQRANAYLDHFYIIIGELEKPVSLNGTLEVYQVMIDEDVKLAPREGLYAVSVAVGGWSGKGLLIINNTPPALPPNAIQPLIYLHMIDFPNDAAGKTATINFHKRLRDQMDFENDTDLGRQLDIDRRQVEELIY